MAEPISPAFEARCAQAFAALAPDESERIRRFATPCRYAAGTRIYASGKPSPACS